MLQERDTSHYLNDQNLCYFGLISPLFINQFIDPSVTDVVALFDFPIELKIPCIWVSLLAASSCIRIEAGSPHLHQASPDTVPQHRTIPHHNTTQQYATQLELFSFIYVSLHFPFATLMKQLPLVFSPSSRPCNNTTQHITIQHNTTQEN
ncbi:hypothetical protein E2C01_072385 [Portunus trituberculatus]|uniref:Uncharacterized protein n=1 Tax=Portunus trituberculatus TaxID=210409 RepID=A0A5B7I7K5_PORTR|nr:hypothetical protein [Portunus trituberculatus]